MATTLEGVHTKLLNEWRKESRRDSSAIGALLKSAKLRTLHEALLKLWKRTEGRDVDTIGRALEELKDIINNPSSLKDFDSDALLNIHRDIFEIDVLYAVVQSDLSTFHGASVTVMNFYEVCGDENEAFANKYLMIGLHLMYLLATNRLAEFHMVLERVDQAVQRDNPYISTPVKLEQSLVEGVYNKIVLTEKTIPSPYYAIFIRMLMDTIRGEIAACIESSYTQIPVKDAAQLLLFSDQSEVVPYAHKRNWRMESSVFTFDVENPNEASSKCQLDTVRIAKQALFYAKQLETIV